MDDEGEWPLSAAESGCAGGVSGSDCRGVVAALDDVYCKEFLLSSAVCWDTAGVRGAQRSETEY